MENLNKVSGEELLARMEKVMQKPQHKVANASQKRPVYVSPYKLAQLAQRVNSRHNSGYSGSRKEQEFCKSHGVRPTFAERVK